MLNGYVINHCNNLLIKVYPQQQGVAKNSKSKQTHVGFSMSILVQSRDECAQIKVDFLLVFTIEISLGLLEGNIIMLMHYCPALEIALELLGKYNLEIQIWIFCNCFSRDKDEKKI